MSERPILFSGPMVKAILEGRKTMTRRVVKPKAWSLLDSIEEYNGKPAWQCLGFDVKCPFDCDRLWVRETWQGTPDCISYRVTDPRQVIEFNYDKWRPSIFMPRWASRITLEVTGVRVERLQEITEEDAMKEGVNWQDTAGLARFTAKKLFMTLWDSINGKKYPWASNPWVWVIAFKKL